MKITLAIGCELKVHKDLKKQCKELCKVQILNILIKILNKNDVSKNNI